MAGTNFFKKAGRVVFWTTAILGALAGSFLLIAVTLAYLRGLPVLGGETLFLTTICFKIMWIFVAVFHFGKETIQLPIPQTTDFMDNARQVLEGMGYEVSRQGKNYLSTRKCFQFLFVARGIQIQCQDMQAHITGSKMWVDGLRRRLRIQKFVAKEQPATNSSLFRGAGRLLKRVQIQVRVPPEQLGEINRLLLQRLAQEAEVVCELNILAQSEKGVREFLVENHIRAWFHEHGLVADIRKDLATMPEPLAALN